MLQKAVQPRMSEAYLQGYDRVSGFSLVLDTVAWARTPAELFVAHGLGFPGSMVGPDADHVDVLRFPITAQMQIEDAVGGTDAASRAITGGPFVDRPPFTGNGFVAAPGHVMPLYWVRHTRVPARSELVRFDRSGREAVLARYVDVATGWVPASGQPAKAGPISKFVGPQAKWHGAYFAADVFDDSVVLATEGRQPRKYGFSATPAGRCRREIARSEAEELFELQVTGRVFGLGVRVVDSYRDKAGNEMSRVSSIEHDADIAEGVGMEKFDAGVYEASLPTAGLTDVVASQLVPRAWTVD